MRSYLLSAWNLIDPLYYTFTRLQYVLDNNNRKTLLRVRLTRYKGSEVVLNDGTVIHKNDLLIKIHLHNVRMIKELSTVKSDIKRAVFIYHMVKGALPRLSYYIRHHHKSNEIKGIIGITTLYNGATRLGFDVVPIKNDYYCVYKKITFLPINLFSGKKRKEDPVYLFMSKDGLLTKHSKNS